MDNTTYVPVRSVAEALGATVRWDGKERKVEITK
ncbi:stalk domain-containing protein [Paenibacillus sp. CECT 9249]|nr:stalk domain-containing protein [Paenibacillus sp. CECT 9249]